MCMFYIFYIELLSGIRYKLACAYIKGRNQFVHPGLQIRVCNRKLFFNKNICCGYSKEPSKWDGYFDHQQHMFKLIGKKIKTILLSKFCLTGPMVHPSSLISLSFLPEVMLDPWLPMRICAGWSESLLGAHANLYLIMDTGSIWVLVLFLSGIHQLEEGLEVVPHHHQSETDHL